MSILLKRAYQPPQDDDGFRVLVDRIWPRGLSKKQLRLDAWMKDIAPSDSLRKWFGHDPEKWVEFARRYRQELDHHREQIEDLRAKALAGPVTLVFAARDEKRNNAVVLKEYLKTKENADRKGGD